MPTATEMGRMLDGVAYLVGDALWQLISLDW